MAPSRTDPSAVGPPVRPAEPLGTGAPRRRSRSAVWRAATLALHVRDPHEKYSWGLCPSAALGFSCPGCGGLRAVNDLTHGDVGAALSSNLLLVVAMPIAVVALGAVGRATGGAARRHRPVAAAQAARVPALLVVVVAFAVARNLAVGAWLAP